MNNLAKLREPFPEHQISLLPRPTKKDAQKGNCEECGGYHGLPAIHLKYVGHAALTDRLLDVDPLWNWEPLALKDGLPAYDTEGGLWIKLTVCGHSRLGYGNAEHSDYKDVGAREKEVIGDALRNAAMRFGAALDLWFKGDLHGDDMATTVKDPAPVVKAPAPTLGKVTLPSPIKPRETAKDAPAIVPTNRPTLHNPRQTDIANAAKRGGWTNPQVKEYLEFKFNVKAAVDLDALQTQDLINNLTVFSYEELMDSPLSQG